jgi:DNA polymerase I-like protein with 3'-5' exonuclease and polymerase domains
VQTGLTHRPLPQALLQDLPRSKEVARARIADLAPRRNRDPDANRKASHGRREADRLNAPVQGTGADGLKLALALLWERRGQCPGAVPVLVCHDEVVIECDAEQAANVKAWLEGAMIEGMDVVLNRMDEVHAPVEVGARMARSWGEGG